MVNQRKLTKPWEVLVFITCAIVFFFAIQANATEMMANNDAGSSGVGTYLMLGSLAVAALIFAFWCYRHIHPLMQQATRPIPGVGEIARDLRLGLNREPTIEEVAAVHQMLTSQRNQAAVELGIGLGAAYLIGHDSHL